MLKLASVNSWNQFWFLQSKFLTLVCTDAYIEMYLVIQSLKRYLLEKWKGFTFYFQPFVKDIMMEEVWDCLTPLGEPILLVMLCKFHHHLPLAFLTKKEFRFFSKQPKQPPKKGNWLWLNQQAESVTRNKMQPQYTKVI